MNNFEMLYFFSTILFSTLIRKVLVCLFLFVCLFVRVNALPRKSKKNFYDQWFSGRVLVVLKVVVVENLTHVLRDEVWIPYVSGL